MMKSVSNRPLLTKEFRYAIFFEPGGQRLARDISKEEFYFNNLHKYTNVT